MTEFPLPDRLAEQARQFYTEGAAPVTPRRAATVVLLRETNQGLEVYLIKRASTMAFASGMYAFPGGTIDPRDAAADLDWRGPSDVEWAARFGLPTDDAQAIVCAAVRELFEESGVLLADVAHTDGEEWEAARRALVSRERSLAELLTARGLALRGDLLVPWGRWITPESEPRRYDTYFFLAALPRGQEARDVSGEADHTTWTRPGDALGYPMLPPTLVTLRALTAYSTLDSALTAAKGRDVATAVTPRVEFAPDGARLVVDQPERGATGWSDRPG